MAKVDTRTNVLVPIRVEDAITRIVEQKLRLMDPNGLVPPAMVMPRHGASNPSRTSSLPGFMQEIIDAVSDPDIVNPYKRQKDKLKKLDSELWHRFEMEIEAYREDPSKTILKIAEDDPADISNVKLKIHPLHIWVNANFAISVPEWAPPTSEMAKPLAETPPKTQDVHAGQSAGRGKYAEGQKLFSVFSWLMDELLTHKHGDWRCIYDDYANDLTNGFFIKGRLNVSQIATTITNEIPANRDGTGPGKTVKKHVEKATKSLTPPQDCVVEFSNKELPSASKMVFGLARAVWKAKTGKPLLAVDPYAYPNDIMTVLAKGLTETTPITAGDLKACLEGGLQQVIKLRDKSTD